MHDQAQSLRELVKKSDTSPDPVSKIITITSGKGGVGKSSITINLAIALSQLGFKVLVIDADFGLANIDVMFGSPARYNLSHLLKGEHTLDEIIQEGFGGVKFISGGSGILELLRMSEEQMEGVLDNLLAVGQTYDIILFDTGAGVNDTVLRLMGASTESILITTPEPTAILDAYVLLKTICQTNAMPEIRIIMNKAESKKEAADATASFVRITKKYLDTDVQPLGSILYDAEMAKSIKQQTPIMAGLPKSTTARNLESIAQALVNLPASKKPSGPLARLFSRWLGQA